MPAFAFIGGTFTGYKLLSELVKKKEFPLFAIILEEDKHEIEKYSLKISNLLNENRIQNSIKKKITESDYEKIRISNLDFIIVNGWRTLIDTKVNEFIKYGLIASHQSLLPKYRGFAPVQWAIINGDVKTGVTLFKINDGETDSGSIFAKKEFFIAKDEYSHELEKRITEGSVELYLKFFDDVKNNAVTFYEQDDSKATYTCKRIPDDGKIEWSKSSNEIYNLIRAVSHPYPGAFCFYQNNCYHITKATLGNNNKKKFEGCIPGRVFKINYDGVEVLCREGTILISEWKNKNTGIKNCPNEIIKSITETLT